MPTPKYTPGPWTFDGENPGNQGFDVALPDGGTLATAYYDVDRDEFSVRQAEANARLIAAAPSLLEACEAALMAQADDCENYRVMQQLRAAVALARG